MGRKEGGKKGGVSDRRIGTHATVKHCVNLQKPLFVIRESGARTAHWIGKSRMQKPPAEGSCGKDRKAVLKMHGGRGESNFS